MHIRTDLNGSAGESNLNTINQIDTVLGAHIGAQCLKAKFKEPKISPLTPSIMRNVRTDSVQQGTVQIAKLRAKDPKGR
nr:MAG: hypothetical protein EDM05_12785 [Leptolyngbya sp. IPPAS B-1204]